MNNRERQHVKNLVDLEKRRRNLAAGIPNGKTKMMEATGDGRQCESLTEPGFVASRPKDGEVGARERGPGSVSDSVLNEPGAPGLTAPPRAGSLSTNALTERDIGRGALVTPGANPRHVDSETDGPNGGQSRSVSAYKNRGGAATAATSSPAPEAGTTTEAAHFKDWALLYDRGVPIRKPFDGRCVFCGHRCYGRACQFCRDLVQLELEAR